MAANQGRAPAIPVGYPATLLGNSSTLALSAAATWLAFQVVPDQAKTLSKVRLFLVTKTGTPAASELTCDLFSDVSGIPGSSLESRPADSAPASGNWMQWSGFTTALTAGQAYWLVFKNTNATPASNSPTYQWCGVATAGNVAVPIGAGSNYNAAGVMYGWNKVHTTNSGTAWATSVQSGVAGPRLEYSDATFDGLPAQAVTRPTSGGTADRAFGKQEVGVRFNVPSGATYNVRGIWFPLAKISTPGALRFRLYRGTTLLDTTYTIAAANVTTSVGDGYTAFFAAPIAISSANNPFRAVFGDATAGDTNAVGYNGVLLNWDPDATSLTMKPMDGSLQKTITADNTAAPPVFTDTNTDVLAFALLLDTGGYLTASGGGGGMLVHPGMSGGMRG